MSLMPVYLDFAQVRNPGRAVAFTPVREALAALPRRLDEAKFAASFYIDCPADMDGLTAAGLHRPGRRNPGPVQK
jgi:hypothetical protein